MVLCRFQTWLWLNIKLGFNPYTVVEVFKLRWFLNILLQNPIILFFFLLICHTINILTVLWTILLTEQPHGDTCHCSGHHQLLIQLWPLRIPNGVTQQDICRRGQHFELLNPYFIFLSLDSLRPQTALRGMNNCRMETFFVRQCGILSYGLGSAYWIFSLLCNLFSLPQVFLPLCFICVFFFPQDSWLRVFSWNESYPFHSRCVITPIISLTYVRSCVQALTYCKV
jgi:hypothetical protein